MTAAAVIMVAVFVAFVPTGDVNIKPIALGLAVGVFVDAFLVRMTLVPAVLMLLGDKAWWIPTWLERKMPSFDVEGEGITHELALADWPTPENDDAIVTEGLTDLDGAFEDVALTVARGGVSAISADNQVALTRLLLTLSGRIPVSEGKVKVCGYVLPARASSVRRKVAYVDLATHDLETVPETLAEHPQLLIVNGADDLSDSQVSALRAILRSHQETTMVVGTVTGKAETIVEESELVGAF